MCAGALERIVGEATRTEHVADAQDPGRHRIPLAGIAHDLGDHAGLHEIHVGLVEFGAHDARTIGQELEQPARGLSRHHVADVDVETHDAAGSRRLDDAGLDLGPRLLDLLARQADRGLGGDGFRLQHGEVAQHAIGEGETAIVDGAESPLAWLARRRDRDGRAYLSPARVAAGERLRGDFTLARMMPTVTSNWSTGRITGGSGTGGLADLTDRSIAARDRVQAALAATGSDLGGLLVDVCCFLKGLERVESERHWPARSAKVVLDIALGRLADHYGLADEARGRETPGRLRHWGTPDHRPNERRSPAP